VAQSADPSLSPQKFIDRPRFSPNAYFQSDNKLSAGPALFFD
jgi:hypothetical protein